MRGRYSRSRHPLFLGLAIGLVPVVLLIASPAPAPDAAGLVAAPVVRTVEPATATVQPTPTRPPAKADSWSRGVTVDVARLRPTPTEPPTAETLPATSPPPAPPAPSAYPAAPPRASPPPTAPSAGGLGARVPASVRRWQASILRWSGEHALDPNLVAALIMTESGGDPNVVSPAGAVGLMQVIGGSTDPDENIRVGAAELAGYLRRYGTVELALAAYNAGPGAVDQYGGVPPFRETRDHVFRVMQRYRLYAAS